MQFSVKLKLRKRGHHARDPFPGRNRTEASRSQYAGKDLASIRPQRENEQKAATGQTNKNIKIGGIGKQREI